MRKPTTSAQKRIEGMYQRAMNLRDSTRQSIDFHPIEGEYLNQYLRAYVKARPSDVAAFRQQTREYRYLLRAFAV